MEEISINFGENVLDSEESQNSIKEDILNMLLYEGDTYLKICFDFINTYSVSKTEFMDIVKNAKFLWKGSSSFDWIDDTYYIFIYDNEYYYIDECSNASIGGTSLYIANEPTLQEICRHVPDLPYF